MLAYLKTSWTYKSVILKNIDFIVFFTLFLSPNIGQDGSRWLRVGAYWGILGTTWEHFGSILGSMLAYVAVCWPILRHLEHIRAAFWKILILYCFLQCFWAPTLAKMAPRWFQVGPCCAKLGRFWGYVGLCWRILGPCWAILKLCWDLLRFFSGEERFVLIFTMFLSPNMNLTWHREREAR